MANPLRSGDGEGTGRRTLAIGEARPIIVRDKDGSVIQTLLLKRTSRPYAFDLADAYNFDANGNKISAPGMIWVVGNNDSLHLENEQAPKDLTGAMEGRNEAERQKWIHRHNHPERYV